MRALILEKPGRLTWHDVPEPTGEHVLVAVRRVGVCGTDIHAFAGRQPGFSYPIRLGHELAVEVLDSDVGLNPGTYCAVNPYLHCGTCSACRREMTNCCESLSVLGVHCDGGFASRLRVPGSHLYASASLPVEALALVEPLVVGYHATRRANLREGEPVLVVGLGPIGLAITMCAQVAGAQVACIDPRLDRRMIARRLTSNILDTGDNLMDRVRDVFGGNLPQVVIDATGSRAAMHQSYHLVAPGGRMAFVGLYPGDFVFEDLNFHRRELTLLASRNGTEGDFLAVLDLMESGTLDPLWLITHRMAFTEVVEHFGALDGARGCIKAMVTMDEH